MDDRENEMIWASLARKEPAIAALLGEETEGTTCAKCSVWTPAGCEDADMDGFLYCPKCGYLYGSDEGEEE